MTPQLPNGHWRLLKRARQDSNLRPLAPEARPPSTRTDRKRRLCRAFVVAQLFGDIPRSGPFAPLNGTNWQWNRCEARRSQLPSSILRTLMGPPRPAPTAAGAFTSSSCAAGEEPATDLRGDRELAACEGLCSRDRITWRAVFGCLRLEQSEDTLHAVGCPRSDDPPVGLAQRLRRTHRPIVPTHVVRA
jgi:hypothetical protein